MENDDRLMGRIAAVPPLGELTADERLWVHLTTVFDEFLADMIKRRDGESLRQAGFTAVADELKL